MDPIIKKRLQADSNGLLTYEYIANHIGTIDEIMPELIENIITVDHNGQFVVSTARYLNAIDAVKYSGCIDTLIKAAIVKDREHVYLPTLAASIWGNDFRDRAEELSARDENFRRIYKRLYPNSL